MSNQENPLSKMSPEDQVRYQNMPQNMTSVRALPPQNFSAESLPMRGPVERISMTPMDILSRAIASGASIEVIERMSVLAEKWAGNEKRQAFENAVAEAKKEIPVIVKNATGHNNKYANFSAYASAIDPVLSAHGLSYRFRTKQEGNSISVTCVLFGHGHSEETTLSGPSDTSGGKNAIQAIGSTLTYLQRYSLIQMLGLAAADDDDGNGNGNGQKRENPHVTRPDDVFENTNEDVLPQPDIEIKQLSKANARPIFRDLQDSLWKCGTADEMLKWSVSNKDKISQLPSDWYMMLRGVYVEHRDAIAKQDQADNMRVSK